MKRYIFLVAAVALATVSCSKTYDTNRNAEGMPISMSTWRSPLTRAPLTAFAVNSEFDVFGYKWKGTVGDQNNKTTVFDGIDVKQTSDGVWEYAGINSQTMRYWDPAFAGYTFFAAYPKDILTTKPAQTGLFVSNPLTYDGANEKLLIAQKTIVVNDDFGKTVQLHFKHCGALVDFKFKKHSDLEKAVVNVTSFSLANIKTAGSFEVASYDGSNNPVGAEVSDVAGLGWTPSGAVNATPAAAPYLNNAGVSLAANTGTDTGTAGALISDLVVMPQKLLSGDGSQTFTIAYTITDENSQVNTYAPAAIEIGKFDNNNDTDNDDTKISAWMPGVHYTYYITINANKIVFSAQVDPWVTTDATGYYYLLN